METLYVVAAIVVLLQLAAWYSQFTKVASLSFQLPLIKLIKGADLPDTYKAFHKVASTPLREMGFKLVGVAKQRSLENREGSTIYLTIFYHEMLKAYALLSNAISPHESDPVLLRFHSHLNDGTIIATDNEFTPIHVFQGECLLEFSTNSDNVKDIWAAHKKHVEQQLARRKGGNIVEVETRNSLIRFNKAWAEDFERAVNAGVVKGDIHQFFLSLKQSQTLLSSFIKRSKLRLKAIRKRLASPETDTFSFSGIVSADLLAGPLCDMARMHINHLNSPGSRPLLAWITFGVSGLLFCLFFGLWLGWGFVPLLLGVILFHELGHFFAMRLSGYSQTSIFFVPGLGAAAAGNAGSAGYWQRLFVFYAGPLPGIVLAFALWFFLPEMSGWLTSLVMVLVILNWFNLLPFMPLDGGQVINLSFRENFRFIFAWISAIGLLLLAWLMSEPVLWVLGAFAAYTAFARAGLHTLRLQLQTVSEKAKSEADFYKNGMRAMQAPAHRHLDFLSRVTLLREFLDEFHMPRVKLHQKLLGFCSYIISFFLPVILFALITLADGGFALDDSRLDDSYLDDINPERDWQAEVSLAADADVAVMLAIEAANYYLNLYEFSEVEHYVSLANEKLEEGGDNVLSQSRLASLKLRLYIAELYDESDTAELESMLLAYLELNPQQNEEFYETLKQSFDYLIYADSDIKEYLLSQIEAYLEGSSRQSELAGVYTQYSYSFEHPQEQIPWIEKSLKLASIEEKEIYENALARAYLNAGLFEQAYSHFQRLGLSGDEGDYLDLDSYAWAAYETQRYQQAIELFDKQYASYKEAMGAWSLLSLVMGNDSSDYVELEARLNQLIVADTMGDQNRIKKYAAAVSTLLDEDKSWLRNMKRSLRESLKYDNDTWYAERARLKLKVLEKYFSER